MIYLRDGVPMCSSKHTSVVRREKMCILSRAQEISIDIVCSRGKNICARTWNFTATILLIHDLYIGTCRRNVFYNTYTHAQCYRGEKKPFRVIFTRVIVVLLVKTMYITRVYISLL